MNTSLSDQLGPLVNAEETALLLGVTVEELRACVSAQRLVETGTQAVRLPRAWLIQGAIRAEIYRSTTGNRDMAGAVSFWREREGQAT